MPRNRPGTLRAQGRTVPIPGVPLSTAYALERLHSRRLSSGRVRIALAGWQQATRMPAGFCCYHWDCDHCWWDEDGPPHDRDVLDAAMAALSARHARPLRALVAQADHLAQAKIVQDPAADPNLPWWWRRLKRSPNY